MLSAIQTLGDENQNIDFNRPNYYLESLETIKRDLIAQSNVRAEEFAKTSHVNVSI